MIIIDIFKFSDGRTVFTGEVVRGPAYINKGEYIIVNPDERIASVTIDGEEIPLKKGNDNWRAVSTRDKLDVEKLRKLVGNLRIIDK